MVFITGGITHASFGGARYRTFSRHQSHGGGPALCRRGRPWEWGGFSRRGTVREDSAIASLWALGMAVGIICIFKTPGYAPGLNEFLFGNILTVASADLVWFALYAGVLVLLFLLFYRPMLAVAFDRDFAATRRLPVRLIDYAMVVMVSLCVVLTIRLVGIMLLLSMLTHSADDGSSFLPVAISPILVASGLLTAVGGVAGLWVAYWLDVPAGACIVFLLIAVYALARWRSGVSYIACNGVKAAARSNKRGELPLYTYA